MDLREYLKKYDFKACPIKLGRHLTIYKATFSYSDEKNAYGDLAQKLL